MLTCHGSYDNVNSLSIGSSYDRQNNSIMKLQAISH